MSKLTSTQVVSAVGTYGLTGIDKFPEGGATFSAAVSEGSTAIVEVRAWNVQMPTCKELLARFVLPVPDGEKAGDLFNSHPVFSIWDNACFVVTGLVGGGSVRLSVVGNGY